jgi:hypothetical protein
MTPAHEAVAARYRASGNHTEADKVLSGEAHPYWLLRHAELSLEREEAARIEREGKS